MYKITDPPSILPPRPKMQPVQYSNFFATQYSKDSLALLPAVEPGRIELNGCNTPYTTPTQRRQCSDTLEGTSNAMGLATPAELTDNDTNSDASAHESRTSAAENDAPLPTAPPPAPPAASGMGSNLRWGDDDKGEQRYDSKEIYSVKFLYFDSWCCI